MHCTHTFPSTITPITQLSPFTHQPWLPHHTCTSFTHSHKSSTQTLTQCEVLFFPWLTFPSVFPSLSSLVLPGLFDSLSWSFAACLSDPAWFTGNPLCLPPALTHCSASDFDSALSTLPSIPLLDICLFDLLFVLIKLHVDLLSPLTSHSLQVEFPALTHSGQARLKCPCGRRCKLNRNLSVNEVLCAEPSWSMMLLWWESNGSFCHRRWCTGPRLNEPISFSQLVSLSTPMKDFWLQNYMCRTIYWWS